MVKKLFKHEFFAFGRIMAIIYAIILTIAAATKIILLFESDTLVYDIVSSMCIIFYVLSIFAAFVFAFALAIVRFYKNLFTAEGYLSFTLPVTTTQHILVKVVTSVSVMLITWLVVFLSACIISAGESLVNTANALSDAFVELYQLVGFHTVLGIAELLIWIVVSLFTSLLLYYTFISIGQLFRKNRILAAVGAYFVYYIFVQIVSTVFMIFFAFFAQSQSFMDLGAWIGDHPDAAFHIFMCGGILLTSAFGAIEFLIVKTIITKKLNLE